MVALVADALLLGFILGRRAYRKRYFAKRDAAVFEFRQKWEALISGEIPYETWRRKPFDRRIIESIALGRLSKRPTPRNPPGWLKFPPRSGLIQKRIFEARELTGWRRMRALVALGRRGSGSISALAEGLRDGDLETRLRVAARIGPDCESAAGEDSGVG